MKKQKMPTEFSRFSWALAAFCLPVLLWPLALLISPNFIKNPSLNDFQIRWMSIFFWVYPFILGIVARYLFKLNQRNGKLAKYALLLSAVIFYVVLIYVCAVGLN
ncbi:DUF5389 domain-containing protein [Haemophilus haemoglobinophilus]|nr:DUF5389 domain-containing protein [Canicola haemoglobinophilus]MBN6712157.1 DUF5389 domain-containing protein [Canicola haemoglobinophilus]